MTDIFIIAGLGNPGQKYENTRHNAGFCAADALAHKFGVVIAARKFSSLTADVTYKGVKYLLLKPQTYMNNSGIAVREAADYFDVPDDHIIILCDDINFNCGRMRIRKSGSAGGHNGLKSIIAHLGSDAFARVRLGVGGPGETGLIDYVLGTFSKSDTEIMQRVYDAAADAALCITENGPVEAMNRYNGIDLGGETLRG